MSLTLEEKYLLQRAQTQGYVTSDVRDNDDPVAAAYQDWCRVVRLPFLHIAYGNATSRVIYNLLEADTLFGATTEEQLRARVPTFCLQNADLEIEDDYVIAGRVLNEFLPRLLEWLSHLSNDFVDKQTNYEGGFH